MLAFNQLLAASGVLRFVPSPQPPGAVAVSDKTPETAQVQHFCFSLCLSFGFHLLLNP